jgi:hypothetical protein
MASAVMALTITLLLASKDAGPGRVKVEEARSLVAEAAQIERYRANDRLTDAYAEALRGDLRKALVDLQSEPQLKAVVEAALQAMDRGDAAALDALAQTLVAKERVLGRAG